MPQELGLGAADLGGGVGLRGQRPEAARQGAVAFNERDRIPWGGAGRVGLLSHASYLIDAGPVDKIDQSTISIDRSGDESTLRAEPDTYLQQEARASVMRPAARSGRRRAPIEPPIREEGSALLILIVAFGALLLSLDAPRPIDVAIDKLMVDLRAPLSVVQWVVTGYLLALTLVLPAFRWAVERVGSRRLYVACLLGFTATSALSALAWSAPSLIAFRRVPRAPSRQAPGALHV